MSARGAWPLAPAIAAAALALLAALGAAPTDVRGQDRGPVVTSLTLFAGTPTGLWRSKDWGGGWDKVAGRLTGEPIGEVLAREG